MLLIYMITYSRVMFGQIVQILPMLLCFFKLAKDDKKLFAFCEFFLYNELDEILQSTSR